MRGPTLPLAPTRTNASIAEKSRNKVELLYPPSSSLLFPSISFQFSSSPTRLFGSTSQVGCLLLPRVTLSLALLNYTLSTYQKLWISILSSCAHVPHGSYLDFCLTYSPFDTWLIVSHPNKCQVSFATLGKT